MVPTFRFCISTISVSRERSIRRVPCRSLTIIVHSPRTRRKFSRDRSFRVWVNQLWTICSRSQLSQTSWRMWRCTRPRGRSVRPSNSTSSLFTKATCAKMHHLPPLHSKTLILRSRRRRKWKRSMQPTNSRKKTDLLPNNASKMMLTVGCCVPLRATKWFVPALKLSLFKSKKVSDAMRSILTIWKTSRNSRKRHSSGPTSTTYRSRWLRKERIRRLPFRSWHPMRSATNRMHWVPTRPFLSSWLAARCAVSFRPWRKENLATT